MKQREGVKKLEPKGILIVSWNAKTANPAVPCDSSSDACGLGFS
jgi:hypothetical protein